MTPAQQWQLATARDAGSVSTDPRELPSSRSAIELVEGKPGAAVTAALHTAARTALIASGLYLAGDRGNVWTHAAGAALTIELFAILWVVYNQ